MDELGAVALAQLLSFGARVGAPEDQMSALFREGQALGERSASDHALARIASGYGIYLLYTTGERGEADPLLAEGVALADRTEDVGLRTVTRFFRQIELNGHDLPRALEVSAEALALCGDDAHVGADLLGYSPRMGLLASRATALSRAGRSAECPELIEEVDAFARANGDRLLEALAADAFSRLAWTLGDVELAVSHARRAVDLCERTENDALRVLCYCGLGRALVLAGAFEDAAVALGRSLELRRENRTYGQWESSTLANRACAELGRGRVEAALRDAADAVRMGALTGTFSEGDARLVSACVSLAAEGAPAAGRAAAELDAAEALLARSGGVGREPWVAEVRAALASVLGDEEARKQQLERAQRLHRERGAGRQADRARAQAELWLHFQNTS